MRLQEIAPRPFAKIGRPEKVTAVGPALATRSAARATPSPVLLAEKPRQRGRPVEHRIGQTAPTMPLPSRSGVFRYTATVNDGGRAAYGQIRATSVGQAKAVLAARGLTPTRVVPLARPVRPPEPLVARRATPTWLQRAIGGRLPLGHGRPNPTVGGASRPPLALFHGPHRIEPVFALPPAMPTRPDPLNTATPPPTPAAVSRRYSPFFHGGGK